MAQKSPAFQFYVKDWMCSPTVDEMSGDAVKAYMYLLCASWLQLPRTTLPNDDAKLAKFAKLSILQWKSMKMEVMQNFTLVDDRWVNLKLRDVSEMQERNRLNAISRWDKGKNNAGRNASRMMRNDMPPIAEAEAEAEEEADAEAGS